MPLLVERIEQGTVIDRIEAFAGIHVLEILKLVPSNQAARQSEAAASHEKSGRSSAAPAKPDLTHRVALVINVPSRHMGRKDILKIEGREIKAVEANKIALIAPRARLNVIRAGKVAQKVDVKLPAKLEDIAACPNPSCISRLEREASVFSTEKGRLRCSYCERLFSTYELVV
ncbi:MAG: aspartate carbamoyltransferase regulatory subunit [Candidatus Marsarchaeota archaeon]|nr:aspartate carbamoyltransferase regulatory subunit [Candidatus Marsarchaeota archaeon]